MPSTNTITAFYSFTQNTKAKATEVNNNFGVFRGHIIPVNTDTVSASDLTHNIGSDSHRFNSGYFGSVDLKSSTSAAANIIQGQTANTTGAVEILIGGSTAGLIDPGGFYGTNIDAVSSNVTTLNTEVSNLSTAVSNLEAETTNLVKFYNFSTQTAVGLTSAVYTCPIDRFAIASGFIYGGGTDSIGAAWSVSFYNNTFWRQVIGGDAGGASLVKGVAVGSGAAKEAHMVHPLMMKTGEQIAFHTPTTTGTIEIQVIEYREQV